MQDTKTDLQFFFDLPIEIQCLILSYNLNLDTLNALLTSGSYYREITRSCVKYLTPDRLLDFRDIPIVQSNLILSLPQLIKCNYPIKINTPQQLIALAHHKKLRYALFNTEALKNRQSFEQFITNLPYRDMDLENLYNQYNEYWFLPLFVQFLPHHLSSPKYQYIFNVEPDGSWIIITQESLIITKNSLAKLILPIFSQIPILQYRGAYDEKIKSHLLALPWLKEIRVRRYEIELPDYIVFAEKGIRVIIRGIKHVWRIKDKRFQTSYLNRLLQFFEQKKKSYPCVTEFVPITLYNLNDIKEVFPNLTTLHLLIQSEDVIPWQQLDPYTKIKIYRHNNNDIIDIPEEFKNRVILR